MVKEEGSKKSILRTAIGDPAETEPLKISKRWGSIDMRIPGSIEYRQWVSNHGDEVKKEKLTDATFVAMILRDFSKVGDFNNADVEELGEEIDKDFTMREQQVFIDWFQSKGPDVGERNFQS